MKEEPLRYSEIDLNDARIKFNLYLNRIITEVSTSHSLQQKACHLAAENFLKFVENQEFARLNYEYLKQLTCKTRSYYLLYIIDILLKNNKFIHSFAKKDLQEIFKVVWDKVYSEAKKQVKLNYLRGMVKTWGIIYLKKPNIQQSIKKWLQQKYQTNLNLSERTQNLFLQSYEKHRNESGSKLQQLVKELNKDEGVKPSGGAFFDFKRKDFF